MIRFAEDNLPLGESELAFSNHVLHLTCVSPRQDSLSLGKDRFLWERTDGTVISLILL